MVLPSFCSDHSPTLIEINFSSARQKAYSKVVYDYESGDYASANMYLQRKNWCECFKNVHDINKINGLINQEVHHVMDTYIPKKKVLVRPRDKPWITTSIKVKMRKRNRAYKKAKSRNLISDWKKFKELRNEVIDLVREAKRQYLINLHNSLVDKSIPPGKWWRIAKSVCKFKNKESQNSPIKVNGEILIHPIEKATAINDYFCSISRFDTEPQLPNVPPLAPYELSDIVITEQDVIDHFQILNINKPAGPDKLPPKFLKAIFPSLVTPLTFIFNKSLQSGTVPSDWKLANVSAIYKGKGDQDNVSNYRPISVTNCFSKILEKIIFKYLHNYIHDHAILTDQQSGFRNKDSTINQLLLLYDEIVKNLDKGKDVRFIFCDVSKAFDRVWHMGLLYKLRKYGIKGNLLNWFKSYLSDRQQRVGVNGFFF
ncbi:Hypothetical predicted protein [Mytilus galloprovincialis]|uniref:Reverse transcriptase domain-containing protein n=1 Tax=Mytilus galloprovincialis TaxID=29158 RepID=A0A8B6CI31_MYTGA|nr:Hypothetical predicted protein [Mytilus galloprovincialis]